MKTEIENLIKKALKNLGITEDVSFTVEHPEDFKNGDYSTNVAMVCAKNTKSNPGGLAEKIVETLRKSQGEFPFIKEIQVAGPGFINFHLSREFFAKNVNDILDKGDKWGRNNLLYGKKIMVEYTQPNPFKPFHIGHLMSNAIGESISRIVEFSGAKVIRANYQGDVGPHVAKAIYVMIKNETDTNSAMAEFVSVSKKAEYIGECYSKGSNLYDTDENAKKEIDEINKKIYDKSDPKINEIYDWGRKITLDAFEEIYKILGTKFDKYFFESEVAPVGEKIVRANIKKSKGPENDRGIFEESDSAIVFHAEKYDPKLHTRVFINSQGLPTYETKEIGLTMSKFKKGLFEKSLYLSIVTTAVEQADYMKVVKKAISIMHPELEKKMKHITHGMMRLSTGKMSSRKGNVVTGESLLNDSMSVVLEKMRDREMPDKEKNKIGEQVGVSALKYSILKSSLGSDIVYDFDKSISFEGDSGPYLQYTAVRANAILNKSKDFKIGNAQNIPNEITDLEKNVYKFPEIVAYAYERLEPHHIAIYLTELASAFNTFYNNTQILPTLNATHNVAGGQEGNLYAKYQLDLVEAFYQTMKNGLWLLGIEVPERM